MVVVGLGGGEVVRGDEVGWVIGICVMFILPRPALLVIFKSCCLCTELELSPVVFFSFKIAKTLAIFELEPHNLFTAAKLGLGGLVGKLVGLVGAVVGNGVVCSVGDGVGARVGWAVGLVGEAVGLVGDTVGTLVDLCKLRIVRMLFSVPVDRHTCCILAQLVVG